MHNIKHLWVIMWHIFTSTNNTTTILFPTQLWELLYTYHVIKQCTEKETASLSNLLLTCYLPSCGFYGPYTMYRNNYIEIHSTKAQVAKLSNHHPSKYLNQNVSPQLQYLLFRIMCLFSEKWLCKQVLNYHNLLWSLQCKTYFDLLMIMSNHR